MKQLILLLVTVLTLASETGCSSCDSRDALMRQVRENLTAIRPKYAALLDASVKRGEAKEDLAANDLGLVDDSISSIDRALGAKAEGTAKVAAQGTPK